MAAASEDTRQKGNETFRERIWLALIEKGLLALVVAVGVALLTVGSDRLKSVWSTTQEKLFDDRFKAYSELLQRADDAVSAIAVTYGVPSDPSAPLAFEPWSSTIGIARNKMCKLYPSDCSGGGGGDIPTGWEIIQALETLHESRRMHRLLIPNDLDRSLNDFMRAVANANDVEISFVERLRGQTKPNEAPNRSVFELAEGRDSWINVLETYRQLADELRATLGLDLTAAKPLAVKQ